MARIRLDATVQSPHLGASGEGASPARIDERAVKELEKSRHRYSLVGRGLRIVRDAAIAVAFMALVPIGVVALRGLSTTRAGMFSDFAHRTMIKTEMWRRLTVPRDPTITPEQAGLAFASLQPVHEENGFTPRHVSRPLALIWHDVPITPSMFVDAPVDLYHVPGTKQILQSAQKGFTRAELAYLRTLASAPAWRAFDLVARAPAVDILGGQFQFPSAPNALPQFRPNEFRAVREMAGAAVSRAAYHVAIGQRDSAEIVLRTIVSFGFALVDNGTSAMDELAGNQIIDIGRVALRQFYELQHDPRVALATLNGRVGAASQSHPVASLDAFRAAQLAIVANPAVHRGERFESLNIVAKSSCSNVTELLTGPRSDVTGAIAAARRDLARYPSERALIDLMAQTATPRVPDGLANPITELAVSAATVAGTAFHNPRFAACTRILTLW